MSTTPEDAPDVESGTEESASPPSSPRVRRFAPRRSRSASITPQLETEAAPPIVASDIPLAVDSVIADVVPELPAPDTQVIAEAVPAARPRRSRSRRAASVPPVLEPAGAALEDSAIVGDLPEPDSSAGAVLEPAAADIVADVVPAQVADRVEETPTPASQPVKPARSRARRSKPAATTSVPDVPTSEDSLTATAAGGVVSTDAISSSAPAPARPRRARGRRSTVSSGTADAAIASDLDAPSPAAPSDPAVGMDMDVTQPASADPSPDVVVALEPETSPVLVAETIPDSVSSEHDSEEDLLSPEVLEPVTSTAELEALAEDLPDLFAPSDAPTEEDRIALAAEQFAAEELDDFLVRLSPEAIEAAVAAVENASAEFDEQDDTDSGSDGANGRRRSRRGRRGGRGRSRINGSGLELVETLASEPAESMALPASTEPIEPTPIAQVPALPAPPEAPADLFTLDGAPRRDHSWRDRGPRRQWGRTYSRDLPPMALPPPKPANGARISPIPQALPPLVAVASPTESTSESPVQPIQFPVFQAPDLRLDAPLAPGETRSERLLEAQIRLMQSMMEQQARQIDLLASGVNSLRQSVQHLATSVGNSSRAVLPRTGIFVDAPNVCYAADNARVALDYGRMLKYLSRDRQLVHAFSYAPITDDVRDGIRYETQRFVAPFLRTGYKLVTKPLKRFPDGSAKGNFDIELAIDIVTMSERLDIVVLVSGDSDFERLIQLIQSKGVRVEVVAFASNVSTELVNIADVFIDIQQHLEHLRAL